MTIDVGTCERLSKSKARLIAVSRSRCSGRKVRLGPAAATKRSHFREKDTTQETGRSMGSFVVVSIVMSHGSKTTRRDVHHDQGDYSRLENEIFSMRCKYNPFCRRLLVNARTIHEERLDNNTSSLLLRAFTGGSKIIKEILFN